MQEWLHVTGAHNKVEYCYGSHLMESSFRSKDLSFALAVTCHLLPYAGVVTSDQGPQLG